MIKGPKLESPNSYLPGMGPDKPIILKAVTVKDKESKPGEGAESAINRKSPRRQPRILTEREKQAEEKKEKEGYLGWAGRYDNN